MEALRLSMRLILELSTSKLHGSGLMDPNGLYIGEKMISKHFVILWIKKELRWYHLWTLFRNPLQEHFVGHLIQSSPLKLPFQNSKLRIILSNFRPPLLWPSWRWLHKEALLELLSYIKDHFWDHFGEKRLILNQHFIQSSSSTKIWISPMLSHSPHCHHSRQPTWLSLYYVCLQRLAC